MIKIKITDVGCYVIGDGPVPSGLDPDEFMKLFTRKILDTKAQGITELILNDENISDVMKQSMVKGVADGMQEMVDHCDEAMARAEVIEVEDDTIDSRRLLDML